MLNGVMKINDHYWTDGLPYDTYSTVIPIFTYDTLDHLVFNLKSITPVVLSDRKKYLDYNSPISR